MKEIRIQPMVKEGMQCLLCGKSSASAEIYGLPPRRGKCPNCGSKPRHRELAWFFQRYLPSRLVPGTKILEVGPSAVQIERFLNQEFLKESRFTAIDIRRLRHHEGIKFPHRFLEMDVTHMTFSDQSFEVILCNHVFPYIRSDYQAMAQIHRCLKSSGLAILNVAHPLAKTKRAFEVAAENSAYTSQYLAENGDEWVYGEDYFERLEAAGFFHHSFPIYSKVEPEFAKEQMFRPEAELILCFKFKDAMDEFLKL